MLPSDLKADVLELAGIAQECPEGLREKCFELLLSYYLKGMESKDQPIAANNVSASPSSVPGDFAVPPPPVDDAGAPEAASVSEHDITFRDVHVKARTFLDKYGKTINDLNQLFYKDAGELRPLYEDLKTTKTSESQTRIALLHALLSGINTGEFQFDGEEVRTECQVRKCYDGGNFGANFRNNSNLFDGFEKYDKQTPVIRLSEAGREALAKVIVELQ